jgi:hypothetical protein
MKINNNQYEIWYHVKTICINSKAKYGISENIGIENNMRK